MKTKAELLAELKLVYTKAKAAYYSADGSKKKLLMSDAEFDALEDRIRKLDPKWVGLKKTGVQVEDKKVEAPLFELMPSLNKMYEDGVDKFYKRMTMVGTRKWIWMDKLDGASLQVVYEKGKPYKLFTRGDGTLGGDVSFLLPALVKWGRIPPQIPVNESTVFRLEALMRVKTFEARWSREAKGKTGFDNIRNMTNGLFNQKKAHPALELIDMVVLGVYGLELECGLELAKDWGFKTVRYSVVVDSRSSAAHSLHLAAHKDSSNYEMDGLVIAPANFVLDYKTSDKPKELVAFKFNDEDNAPQVKVESIIWQKTRLKRWIGKVKIPPTLMDGAMVEHATAHNAKWMMDRGIGPGAIIKVLRSGGVIPKIVGVVKTAKFEPPPGPYKIEGVHFLMLEGDKASDVRGIHHFMTTLDVEFLAAKTLEKLYYSGLDSPEQYIDLVYNYNESVATNFLVTDGGLGEKQSAKIVVELCRVLKSKIPIKLLMVASGCFEKGGMGKRKLEQLEAAGLSMGELLTMSPETIRSEVPKIKGFNTTTAEILVAGVIEFRKWYKRVKTMLDVDGEIPKKKVRAKGLPLAGLKVAWTSYRSKDEEKTVEENGGDIVKYGASMDILLYRETARFMDKIEKAGAKAITWDKFCIKYGVK